MSDIYSLLEKYNFWGKNPTIQTGYERTGYLNILKSTLNIPTLIKVIIGQRRVGKSYLLKQVIKLLIQEKKVPPKNILYLNFELDDFSSIKNKDDLKNVIELFISKHRPTGIIYLFFDEIQEVSGWEKIVNSYRTQENFEIFISGSNSKLLSGELSTYLSGRFIECTIHPFSFEEFLGFHQLLRNKGSLIEYINFSGIPEIYNLPTRELQASFMKSLKNTIILRDLIQRYSIKDIDLIEKIFLFTANNVGNLFSLNSIRKKLKQEGVTISTTTLSNYIRYFEEVFIISGVNRYDLHGKKILEGEKKYYLNDLGFMNFLFSHFESYVAKKLENFVYSLLASSGYTVYIGKLGDLEIDFIAEKAGRKIYIQVAYILSDEDVIEREYGNLRKIGDSWEKYVISLDDILLPPDSTGIKHLQAWNLEILK